MTTFEGQLGLAGLPALALEGCGRGIWHVPAQGALPLVPTRTSASSAFDHQRPTSTVPLLRLHHLRGF